MMFLDDHEKTQQLRHRIIAWLDMVDCQHGPIYMFPVPRTPLSLAFAFAFFFSFSLTGERDQDQIFTPKGAM